MAERRHHISADVRITVRTERVWLYLYQSWGASITREQRVGGSEWWNPFTWFDDGRWERRGEVGEFAVQFLGGDGSDLTSQVAPAVETSTGFRKVSITFAQIGYSGGRLPGGADLDDLGTDARAVADVVVRYRIGDQDFVLSHQRGS